METLLSGLTVAPALVPEAVAFAFVAGIHPLAGLYAAFMVGLVAAHGVEYLFATIVLMGMILMSAGILRLGKFIRIVPHPVLPCWSGLSFQPWSSRGNMLSISKHINARISKERGSKIYELHGPLFFGSVSHFRALFDPKADVQDVIVDFRFSRMCGHSGLEAIDALAERYSAEGKRLHLRHLGPDCRRLLHKAGKMVEANVIEDPHYRVAIDGAYAGFENRP